MLEIGTSNGYSAIWLADALGGLGGHLLTVDLDPARVAQARANLARAGPAVDNAVSHAAELAAFRDLVDATPGVRSDLFDVGTACW